MLGQDFRGCSATTTGPLAVSYTHLQNIAFIHDRMPVILPEGATCDWLNLRYKADEVLKAAVLDVEFAPAELA